MKVRTMLTLGLTFVCHMWTVQYEIGSSPQVRSVLNTYYVSYCSRCEQFMNDYSAAYFVAAICQAEKKMHDIE